ncbi:GMC family oxidoreductase [Pseudanabaena sp. FACHB-2040]|uniref:GMC oxidoreductase n=1 Tax=Pseudanabaena sp. FACHB-2040 TaxID=2692859 RepID=UPI00168A3698|nr:GMC family oxidoreductase [Pseudanabaena sp. FACHB-2040]MBD2256612.1 GMC family oxidoreductase [Pseudanabaena sp. FACHB-2040]
MAGTSYDIIIIGTGAGGGTLAHRLASSGKKILLLERGRFLPVEMANRDAVQVFQRDRYRTSEVWFDRDDEPLHPSTSYYVGGNTKVYGGALFRLREQDFDTVHHDGGLSPEWPLKYQDLEPYYTEAENLYQVHGQQGLDPTEPVRSKPYPFSPIVHEPRIQEIHDGLKGQGLQPFPVPLAIKLHEGDRCLSQCVRCSTCDGFPCMIYGKSDADINCIRPALGRNRLTLITEAKVTCLHTSPSGREVIGVETQVGDQHRVFSAGIVVVACGAVNSAALLLRSANDLHPNGLANSSDQVGRNFMKHQNGVVMSVGWKINPTVFQKTVAINDFYWGEPGFDYPMGHVQLLGKINKDMLSSEAPKFLPGFLLEKVAHHSVDWLAIAEDLPDPQNRVRLKENQIVLDYRPNNTRAFDRLIKRWIAVLKSIDRRDIAFPCSLYFSKRDPLQRVAHQVGTCRFGIDPQTSVLDINCRTHDVDNLYVVDGSFFPSSAAINPALTIMANALRVGDHLLERLK